MLSGTTRMKRYEPLPAEEVRACRQRLAVNSLADLVGILGPPACELGPSEWTATSVGQPVETIHHIKSLVFCDVTPLIKTLLVHVCDDGRFDWEFRGRELPDGSTAI
jgi:hypothetical protein